MTCIYLKRNKKHAVGKPKTRPGKKRTGAYASKPPRTNASRKARAKSATVSPSSSSSEDIDEDYAEFLKTYVPEEFYAYGPSPSVDEGSQIYFGVCGEDAEVFKGENLQVICLVDEDDGSTGSPGQTEVEI
ncbi:hypothetical protein QL285_032226 [Trifolium repens]|nr:hypothetical protein QL285_032226 [Trifolium repens]